MSRVSAPRASMSPGDVLDLAVGEVAHGGWCTARNEGVVVFVRHALPGERVSAVVTQTTARFARADAVEIVEPAADRVRPPCPYARPGGCGGCDWQHVSLRRQRQLKAHVVEQQLRRIAGIIRPVTVEPLPGEVDGLGWRTRVRFAVGPDGQAGLFRHRSHEIVPVADCLIAHGLVNEVGVTRRPWPPGVRAVEVAVAVAPGAGGGSGAGPDGSQPGGGQPGCGGQVTVTRVGGPGAGLDSGPRYLSQLAAGRRWRVAASGFWQVHPAAADALATAVLAGLAPAPGERALDLFCGAGLFAGVLADAVGPEGAVTGVDADASAVRDARHNVRSAPWVTIHHGDAVAVLERIGLAGATVAVLDPPRAGVPRSLIALLSATPSSLQRVGYVSCDPATLARDLAEFVGQGWELSDLRAFDAFPMTHHVECVAILRRGKMAPCD
jgi:tRNA/tmRNA/rRNA uracil-C5-methylase (TrmA/RlmC/RlmD family)